MMRECQHCHKNFAPNELCKDVSKEIEAARKASGVEGVHFRCYACSHCGFDNLFVDLVPREGESDADFQRRKAEVEATVQQVHPEGAEVVLVERAAH